MIAINMMQTYNCSHYRNWDFRKQAEGIGDHRVSPLKGSIVIVIYANSSHDREPMCPLYRMVMKTTE